MQDLPARIVVAWYKVGDEDFVSLHKYLLMKGTVPNASVKVLRQTSNYSYIYEGMAFKLETYIKIVNAVLVMDGLVNNRPIDVINESQTEAVETIFSSMKDGMDIDQFKDSIRSLSMTQPLDFQGDIKNAYHQGRIDQLKLFGIGGIDPEVVDSIDEESENYANKWIKDKLELK